MRRFRRVERGIVGINIIGRMDEIRVERNRGEIGVEKVDRSYQGRYVLACGLNKDMDRDMEVQRGKIRFVDHIKAMIKKKKK